MKKNLKQIKVTNDDIARYLWDVANKCAIPMGRWTKEDRVMLVYSALCAMSNLPHKARQAPFKKTT